MESTKTNHASSRRVVHCHANNKLDKDEEVPEDAHRHGQGEDDKPQDAHVGHGVASTQVVVDVHNGSEDPLHT
jgi:hypothetical protein